MTNPMHYLPGFANHWESEALAGALPLGRNSPQRAPHGLYTELLSGTAFTAPRAENRRTWMYRARPAVGHGRQRRLAPGRWLSPPFEGVELTPAQLRWDPPPLPGPGEAVDFIDGLITMGGNGKSRRQKGGGVTLYSVNRSMDSRICCNADAEMLVVPQLGALCIDTELGRLIVEPCEIALIPRGLRFRINLVHDTARGYALENYGPALRLPELGPIGSNGLANTRDFLAPVARYELIEAPHQLITRFQGQCWAAELDHSPFNVVAWQGNLAPQKYDLRRFNTMGTVSYDHPDPSIGTVLTSPSGLAGTANCDFAVFPPRWLVAEDTFRPPWFHRNVMSEFVGLIYGVHDSKEGGGFVPGGSSLHNSMSPHGPDAPTFETGSRIQLAPVKLDNTMAFMFETRLVIAPTAFALQTPWRQNDYPDCWQGLRQHFTPESPIQPGMAAP